MDVELQSAANYITMILQRNSNISEFKINKFNKKLNQLLLDEYKSFGYKRILPDNCLYKEIRVSSYIDIIILEALNKIHLSDQSNLLFPTRFSVLIFKNLVLYKTKSKEIIIYDNSISNRAYNTDFYDKIPFLYDKRQYCNII